MSPRDDAPPYVDIYVRISLDRTGQEAGVERQEKECREWCERRGWPVRHVFVDNDVSATTGKERPGFEALLQAGSPAIVVWHTDRLVRLTKDLQRVIDLKVPVNALPARNFVLSTPAGRATAITVTAWSQYEGEQKSLRQKSAARQRSASERPTWTTRPFGYEKDGSLVPAEAALVVQAYRDVLVGRSLYRIARDLHEAVGQSPMGKVWSPGTVRKMLLAPRNIAMNSYRGEPTVPGAWDPLIDVETYEAVKAVLTAPGRREQRNSGKVKYLLSGLAKCGECGGKVGAGGGRTTRDGLVRNYRCPNPLCGKVARKAEFVEQLVRGQMIELLQREGIVEMMLADSAVDTSELVQRREAIRVQITEIGTALGKPGASVAPLLQAIESLQEHLAAVDAELAAAARVDLVTPLIEADDVEAAWDGTPVERQRAVIDQFFEVLVMPKTDSARHLKPHPSMVRFVPKGRAAQPLAAAPPA